MSQAQTTYRPSLPRPMQPDFENSSTVRSDHSERARRPPLPLPQDHIQALAALLQPTGPDLARRWVSALMLVDEHDRPALVSAMERAVHKVYPLRDPDNHPLESIRPDVMLRLVRDAPERASTDEASDGDTLGNVSIHDGRSSESDRQATRCRLV